MARKKVALSILGTTLDNIVHEKRHQRWRPTISLMQSMDPAIDHLVLFAPTTHAKLVQVICSDIEALGKTVEVIPFELGLEELWKLDIVYSTFYDFATSFPFDPQKVDYFIHITTGTHIAQIALFLLVEAGYLPGVLVQSSPGPTVETKAQGSVQIIDLDLSKYEAIMARYEKRVVQNTDILKAGIETRNAAFNEMIAEIETVAASGGTILLTGPTGAGKTRMASKIHSWFKPHFSEPLKMGSFGR